LKGTINFFLPNVIKRTQFSCWRVMSALYHVPLFMNGTLLLLLGVKTAVDLQLLQTRCAMIQLAMTKSRRDECLS